jgi:catechol-2,3-dioxygenase
MSQDAKFASTYISHYGIRARRLPEMIDWYKRFLQAEVVYDAGIGVFMTFDDEHHRLVLWTDDETEEKVTNSAGVDHIGFGLPDHGALIQNYERLKELGIMPALTVNHHFTTSFYYNDPDGNEVEFSVDNFPDKSACRSLLGNKEMMDQVIQPPFFGSVFDAEELVQMYHSGATVSEMAAIGKGNG